MEWSADCFGNLHKATSTLNECQRTLDEAQPQLDPKHKDFLFELSTILVKRNY